MGISDVISILEKLLKGWIYVSRESKNNPSRYLEGPLNSGHEVAQRIIALFEAHGVRRTQIYRLVGDSFPGISPSLDAEKLQSLLGGELIKNISKLFGVRQAWIEGEAGRIYDPLAHYKDFPSFVNFIRELKERNPNDLCLLTALKSKRTSDDLYAEFPEVALFFSEPVAELDSRTIYRHSPLLGPFSWGHPPCRYHLCAFFNFAYETPSFYLKGFDVAQKHINKVSAGEAIPMNKVKITGIWQPVDYAYPLGQITGRVRREDWRQLIRYFDVSSGLIAQRFPITEEIATPKVNANYKT